MEHHPVQTDARAIVCQIGCVPHIWVSASLIVAQCYRAKKTGEVGAFNIELALFPLHGRLERACIVLSMQSAIYPR